MSQKSNRPPRSDMDRARDELMSLVHQCDVLQAEEAERNEWLKETIEFLGQRYSSLSKLDRAQLELIGRRFCAPVIGHGTARAGVEHEEAATQAA